jgi:hypothetical protein
MVRLRRSFRCRCLVEVRLRVVVVVPALAAWGFAGPSFFLVLVSPLRLLASLLLLTAYCCWRMLLWVQARRSSMRRRTGRAASLALRSWLLLRQGCSRRVPAWLGSRRGGWQTSFATAGSCARSGCACFGLQDVRHGFIEQGPARIPLLPPGRGGIGMCASLWLSRSSDSRSFRILVSSRAERSDTLRAGWLRAARFRFLGCSPAASAGPVSGT